MKQIRACSPCARRHIIIKPLFLGVHSTRIVADGWCMAMVGRLGVGPWKGLYALLSIVGFVLLGWGFGLARQPPVVLWLPPVAMLMLVAFILLAAAYVPRNAVKARLHHPMGWGGSRCGPCLRSGRTAC